MARLRGCPARLWTNVTGDRSDMENIRGRAAASFPLAIKYSFHQGYYLYPIRDRVPEAILARLSCPT